jgi:hypothetical protein
MSWVLHEKVSEKTQKKKKILEENAQESKTERMKDMKSSST